MASAIVQTGTVDAGPDDGAATRLLLALGATTGLDGVAALVADLLAVDVAFVSVLGSDHTFLVGATGTAAPPTGWDPVTRRVPVDGSMCAIVRDAGGTTTVDDVRVDDRFGPDGIHRRMGVRALAGAPLRDGAGRIVGAVCAGTVAPRHWRCRDVTTLESLARFAGRELVRAVDVGERLEQADELALVVGRLRHELCGDLTVVLGGIDTALHPCATEEMRRDALDTARTDALRVIDVMDALLRTDSRTGVRVGPERLDALVAGAMRALGKADAARVDVACEDVEVAVAGRLVTRVVANLVGNALKHTCGRVTLDVHTEDGQLRVVVVDHGAGFDPTALARLYEPFASTDRQHDGGFGLGLFIVRELVHRLDGSIDVDSTPSGSTITVAVPVHAA